MFTTHREDCLSINGIQSVRLGKGTIEFKNYFKQILASFQIYVGFASDLESVEIYEGSCSKKYQNHNPSSFAYIVVCIDDRSSKAIVVFRGENTAYVFIKAILKEYEYCRKVMKKFFNKNLIMNEEEEKFQLSNVCWISEKLIDNYDEEVRDHCHVTEKFRGAVHWSCLQLTKKVPVIFHNLRGYDSHLIFDELKNFDVKINVIPNGLEKYIALF